MTDDEPTARLYWNWQGVIPLVSGRPIIEREPGKFINVRDDPDKVRKEVEGNVASFLYQTRNDLRIAVGKTLLLENITEYQDSLLDVLQEVCPRLYEKLWDLHRVINDDRAYREICESSENKDPMPQEEFRDLINSKYKTALWEVAHQLVIPNAIPSGIMAARNNVIRLLNRIPALRESVDKIINGGIQNMRDFPYLNISEEEREFEEIRDLENIMDHIYPPQEMIDQTPKYKLHQFLIEYGKFTDVGRHGTHSCDITRFRAAFESLMDSIKKESYDEQAKQIFALNNALETVFPEKEDEFYSEANCILFETLFEYMLNVDSERVKSSLACFLTAKIRFFESFKGNTFLKESDIGAYILERAQESYISGDHTELQAYISGVAMSISKVDPEQADRQFEFLKKVIEDKDLDLKYRHNAVNGLCMYGNLGHLKEKTHKFLYDVYRNFYDVRTSHVRNYVALTH